MFQSDVSKRISSSYVFYERMVFFPLSLLLLASRAQFAKKVCGVGDMSESMVTLEQQLERITAASRCSLQSLGTTVRERSCLYNLLRATKRYCSAAALLAAESKSLEARSNLSGVVPTSSQCVVNAC